MYYEKQANKKPYHNSNAVCDWAGAALLHSTASAAGEYAAAYAYSCLSMRTDLRMEIRFHNGVSAAAYSQSVIRYAANVSDSGGNGI